MRTVATKLLYLLFFIVALFMVLPYERLYFALEKELEPHGIIMNEDAMHSRVFGFSAQKLTLYMQGIAVADIDDVSLIATGFFNRVHASSVVLNEEFSAMLIPQISDVSATYSPFNPLKVSVSGDATVGTFEVELNLLERVGVAYYIANEGSMAPASVQKYFTAKEDTYSYEFSF